MQETEIERGERVSEKDPGGICPTDVHLQVVQSNLAFLPTSNLPCLVRHGTH